MTTVLLDQVVDVTEDTTLRIELAYPTSFPSRDGLWFVFGKSAYHMIAV